MSWPKVWMQPQSGLDLLVAYILLGGAIFALQLFPIPFVSLILMVLAAPLWIGLLVHIAMAQFAWCAYNGTISRAWLALPLSFYGGGLALHVASVMAAELEAVAINSRNTALRLSVDQPFRYLLDGYAAGDTLSLLEHFRVDRAFVREGKSVITTYYYARGEACDVAPQGYGSHGPRVFRKDIFYYYSGSKTRQCILFQDGLPTEWHYRITANYTYAKDRASWLFARRGKAFEIYDERDNQLLGTIELATFTSFPILPWIVAGCGLNSGAAKWQCGFAFTGGGTSIAAGYKQRAADDPQKNPFTPSLDAETWEVTQLARALGLEQRQPID